jgi:peptidyl-prolyl cis-trans isomerase A (cyclophilin A)
MQGHRVARGGGGLVLALGVLFAIGAPASAQDAFEKLRDTTQLTETAPPAYRARFDTSQGPFVIEVHREWAPLAADRFYNLVKNGFYDETRFFRVVSGFVAQFGLHAEPSVQARWQTARMKDEPVVQSNTRGRVSFTQESMPGTRFTMVFINYADNSRLDKSGFAAFGEIVSGMDVVDALYGGYGTDNAPDQRRILRQGNAYLLENYPMLDYVKTARIGE